MRPPWKLIGLAGVAGVAATGVVVVRRRRAHVDLAPDELRERLRARLAQVPSGGVGDGDDGGGSGGSAGASAIPPSS